MMGCLVEQLINITDTIFLGHVGETELGASAIGTVYYLIVYMLGFGFSIGLQVMIARRNGEQKYEETGKTFFQGLYFLIVLSIVLIILSHLATHFLMHKVIASLEVYSAVKNYTDWRCFGLLFAFPALAFRAFYVGIVKTKFLTINAFIMITTNIIMNYVLIFGKAGFPVLGIAGAAVASTTSECISLIMFILHSYTYVNKLKYGLHLVFAKQILMKVIRLSVWSMFYSFLGVAPWFLFFISIEHLGKNQLAAANIIRSISTLFFVIVSSFASTTGSLVSNLIGNGKTGQVMPLCRKIIKLGYAIGIPILLIAFIFHEQLISIYTDNEILIKEAYYPFIVMISIYFLAIPAYIYNNAIFGTGNTRIVFIFQIITILIYLSYLYILNSFSDIPLAIYWFSEFLFVAVLFFLSFSYIRKTFKNI